MHCRYVCPRLDRVHTHMRIQTHMYVCMLVAGPRYVVRLGLDKYIHTYIHTGDPKAHLWGKEEPQPPIVRMCVSRYVCAARYGHVNSRMEESLHTTYVDEAKVLTVGTRIEYSRETEESLQKHGV